MFDADAPVPAHDAGRNLVSEREGEHGRVIAELGDLGADLLPDLAPQRAVVEKRDVLRPRQPDHHAQAVACRFVEQLALRRGVGADGVDAEVRHEPEILGDCCAMGTGSPARPARTCRR